MVTATKREPSASPRSSQGPSQRPASRRGAEITAAVKPIAQGVADAHELVLWGITFLRDAGRETLRVACDRVGGVTADELARYSEQLSREIDRSDVVPGDRLYVLEVTSPGAERKLESPQQFEVCIGRVAKMTLSGGRTVEGPIMAVTGHEVEVDGEGGPVRALFTDIVKARLVVKL